MKALKSVSGEIRDLILRIAGLLQDTPCRFVKGRLFGFVLWSDTPVLKLQVKGRILLVCQAVS